MVESTVVIFKQKTGYEMRISAWSSDVVSSGLPVRAELGRSARHRGRRAGRGAGDALSGQHREAFAWLVRAGSAGMTRLRTLADPDQDRKSTRLNSSH